MRSTFTLRSVVTMYALGITWCAFLLGATAVLAGPLTSAYGSFAVDVPLAAMLLTTALAMLVATAATGGAWFALKRLTAERGTIASHA